MEYLKLNNGTQIPAAGMGTFLLKPADAEQSVITALENGYELIDTANAYQNEKAVGRGMKKSGLEREKIYLSTKLWLSEYADADRAIDDTLKRLDTDYIDLLFLHQPIGDYISAYQAMERAVKAGKVRSLGLSNFPENQIGEVAAAAGLPPAVLQTEAHPYAPQHTLKEYLKSMGTVIMAWYPLGHGDPALQKEPVFTELGEKYGKSSAQIILRWHTQEGNIVIPASKNAQHICDNIHIFDFSLTEEELQQIRALDKNTRYYTATKEALEGYLAFAPNFNCQE